MKTINPKIIVYKLFDWEKLNKLIEKHARLSHDSQDKITDDSYKDLIPKLMKWGHLSVIEHSMFSVQIICDRGISHELVRHRLASITEQSTRYCNLTDNMEFIKPFYFDENDEKINVEIEGEKLESVNAFDIWFAAMAYSEWAYKTLINEFKISPEEARNVLPNSLKTQIGITANLREWRHILKLRTSRAAHPQMREIMLAILNFLNSKFPILFKDIITNVSYLYKETHIPEITIIEEEINE